MRDVRLEQANRRDWARGAGQEWDRPETILAHLRDNTNQFAAARLLDWDALCGADATALDLGCGSGWLTAMLTRQPAVERVVAWDSSPHMVEETLPAVVGMLDGDIAKVERVCGEFVPLLLDDDSIDLVAMSSAFHHCDTPLELLADLRRVLRPGGRLVLLNETPWKRRAMLGFSARTFASAIANVVDPRSRSDGPGHLAADHVLYDPALGDRGMTFGQWRALARRARWSLEVVDTGLPPYPEHFRPRARLQPNLTHFLLTPA